MALTRPRAYQIYDIDYKQAVRVVSLSDVTLSGGAPNSVDGVNLSLNDRILVAGQNNPVQNGIYYVTTLGSGSNGTWNRSTDTDTTGELLSGTIVMVTEGTTYADTQWKLTTDDPITIGVSSLTFVQNYLANSISYGSTSFTIASSNANATISVSATSNVAVFSTDTITFAGNILPTSNVTYSLGTTTQRWKDLWLSNSTIYLGNVVLGATDNQLTVGGANVVTSTSSGNISGSGNITGGNILTTGLISATGNITGSNINGVGGSFTGNLTFGNIFVGGYYYANGAAFIGGGGGTPGGSNTYVQFNDNGVFNGIAGFTFDKTTNALSTTGAISTTGNITGSYIIGNGSQLTGLPAGYTDANVSSLLAAFGSNTISTTGTITAGNITGSNLLTNGLVSAASHIGSVVSVSGNVTGGNLIASTGLTAGTLSLSGNTISSTDNTITIDPATSGSGGDVVIQGNLRVTGNVTYIDSNVVTTNDLVINVANNAATASAANGGGIAVGPVGGEYASLTYNSSGNTWTISNGATVSGILSANGNITGGNVLATTTVSAASHIGATVSLTGTMTAVSTVGGVITGSSASVTGALTGASLSVNSGNITAGNLNVSGAYVDTGDVLITSSAANGNVALTPTGTGTVQITGAASASGNITSAANISGGNVLATTIVSGASHIGSIVSVSANLTGGNVLTGGLISSTGNITSAANILGGNVLATTTVSAASHIGATVSITGTMTAASTVGGVITGTSVSTTGNITSAANVAGGNVLATTTVSAASHIGTTVSITGTMTAASTVGGVITGTSVSTTGNITSAANIAGGNVLATTTVSAASHIGSTVSVSGALTAGVSTISAAVLTAFNLDPAGTNIATYGGGSASSGRGIIGWNRSAGSGEMSFIQNQNGGSPGGFIFYNWANTATNTTSAIFAIAGTTSNVTIYGNIVNGGANSTGNIGSSTGYFNTVFAKATSAQYADVAEYYASDAHYDPGTVVSFGGEAEVTICYRIGDDAVAGVVSTNPAYIMNAGIDSTCAVPVALTGRVPTKVLGPVRKGNMMISAGNGYAQACSTPAIGTVIGKAIENFDGTEGIIEIVVGRV